MNKVIAFSILGMGLTGAVLMFLVPLHFNTPSGNVLNIVTAGSITAFVVFTISALLLRRRLDQQIKNEDHLVK
ncbi:hypothetical protein [Jeotgalibacillus sp. R-1-5s-1]|uniref:hypothetical protein n=1 Tax=Jeotgalibacillus sp. R-1-5s-1 TaxID=2555897 RepID=UPI00106D7747|nr:hypothetical protein [Jeotgalibacillus sp. R-1-5s-1]TFD94344.1 hypothetical protein E2491_12940 [Jeotgalibacillus sp. R-1-5s-1]